MNLTILHTSCKWNHAVSVFLCLAYFIHIVACVRISFLLRLKNMLLYVYNYILFIHSSINGCLVSFQLLAIMNNAAVNRDIQISL